MVSMKRMRSSWAIHGCWLGVCRVVPDLSDPEDIRVWLHERAAIREDSGAVRVEADKAAFDELLWIWHAANPIEHTPGRGAACGTAFESPVMSLPV